MKSLMPLPGTSAISIIRQTNKLTSAIELEADMERERVGSSPPPPIAACTHTSSQSVSQYPSVLLLALQKILLGLTSCSTRRVLVCCGGVAGPTAAPAAAAVLFPRERLPPPVSDKLEIKR